MEGNKKKKKIKEKLEKKEKEVKEKGKKEGKTKKNGEKTKEIKTEETETAEELIKEVAKEIDLKKDFKNIDGFGDETRTSEFVFEENNFQKIREPRLEESLSVPNVTLTSTSPSDSSKEEDKRYTIKKDYESPEEERKYFDARKKWEEEIKETHRIETLMPRKQELIPVSPISSVNKMENKIKNNMKETFENPRDIKYEEPPTQEHAGELIWNKEDKKYKRRL